MGDVNRAFCNSLLDHPALGLTQPECGKMTDSKDIEQPAPLPSQDDLAIDQRWLVAVTLRLVRVKPVALYEKKTAGHDRDPPSRLFEGVVFVY